MNNCNCNSKPYTVESIHDVAVDDLATLPDEILGLRRIEDSSTGSTIITPVRVPAQKLFPTGNLANVVALTTNNTALSIPEGQVRAGYINVQPGGNIIQYASASAPAMFLMLGEYSQGKMLVQSTGFLTIPGGHQYLPGEQYYLGENGEPVTDSTITGQKLFMPLSDTVLMVNGDF